MPSTTSTAIQFLRKPLHRARPTVLPRISVLAVVVMAATVGRAGAARAQDGSAEQTGGATPASPGKATEAAVPLSEAPRSAPVPAPTAYDAEGPRAIREGRYGDAIRIYSEAVSAHPNEARYHYMLGKVRALAGDRRNGTPDLREAARLSPSNADYHAELGNAYYIIGATQAAASAYRMALRLRPDHSSATAQLWMSRVRLAEHESFVSRDVQPSGVPKSRGSWEGPLTLTADMASIGLMALAIAERRTFGDDSSRGLFLSGLGLYVFASFIHLAYDNVPAFLLRGPLFLLVGVGPAAALVAASGGVAASGLNGLGVVLGVWIFFFSLVGTGLDAAFAFDKPAPRSVSVTPWFVASPGAGGFALQGRL